jgi:hypothetical protein
MGVRVAPALLSVAGGLAGAALLERLKAGVASLDVELVRLETFEDDLFDAFEHASDDEDRPTLLRKLTGCRRRLGQNIRRKVPDSAPYEACKAQLVKLDGYLSKAEDAEPLTDILEADIQAAVSTLRHHLRRSSRTARVFAILRGEA